MPFQIFLSYRRDDAASETGRLFDRLTAAFNQSAIFQDVEEIKPGESWPNKIRATLTECKVVIVVIGPRFLKVADEWGVRRIDRHDDWVRCEIESALQENKLIIPLLMEGAELPPSTAFPASIAALANLQSLEIRRNHWKTDFPVLLSRLQELIPGISSRFHQSDFGQYAPLSLLPKPNKKPPLIPFVGLRHFTEDETQIFFGRGKEIRMIYDLLTNSYDRVFLLNGPSAVGKSSLLHAGLVPRLKFKFANIHYKRLGSDGTALMILQDFIHTLKDSTASLIVIDQMEEIWSARSPGFEPEEAQVELFNQMADEETAFTQLLKRTTLDFPECRFILSFRKEWHAEMRELMDTVHLKYKTIFLAPLDNAGIREAVEGITNDNILREFYSLRMDADLPEQISTDLTRDNQSHIGPILQMMLRNMWDKAYLANPDDVYFSKDLYQRFYYENLTAMVQAQLEELTPEFAEEMNSGMILDLLRFFTTDLGTAARRTLVELNSRYINPVRTGALITALQNLFFLQSDPNKDAVRLSHDALAPVLRVLFDHSDAPGQRAFRLLEGKKPNNDQWDGVGFSETDIEIIKTGWKGMPILESATLLALNRSRIEISSTKENLQNKQRLAMMALSSSLVHAAKHAFAEKKHDQSFRLAQFALETFPKNSAALTAMIKAQSMHPARYVLAGHLKMLRALNISPDGTRIVTASQDFKAMIWDLNGDLLTVLEGHTGELRSVQFSPDGKSILTASHDKTVRIWNEVGNIPLIGHSDVVICAKYSSDGARIISASGDKTARIWNTKGKCLHVLEGHQQVIHVAEFSPDNQHVVTASVDKTVRLWDAEGNLLHTLSGHKDWIYYGGFSPDGTCILTASDTTVIAWALDGQVLFTLEGHTGMIRSVMISPDNQLIATASEDKTTRIWDTKGNLLHILTGHQDKVSSARFSLNSSRIVTASLDRTAKIWDTNGQLIETFDGHSAGLYDAQFLAEDNRLITISLDCTARIWDTDGRKIHTLAGHKDWVNWVQFSSDGNLIATASNDKTARLWDINGNLLKILDGHKDEVSTIMFSPDDKQVITASKDKTAKIWSTDGQLLKEIAGHTSMVLSAEFSTDGSRIITTSADKTARVWDTEGNLLIQLNGHTETVVCGQFFSDGKLIMTASIDDTIRIWNEAGFLVKTIKTKPLYRARLSPDNSFIIAAHKDQTARIWSLEGQVIRTFIGHKHWVCSARISPNGKVLVTTSIDKTVRLWDISSGQLYLTLEGHEGATYDACFYPFDNKIISTSQDKTARTWFVYADDLVNDANERGFACLTMEEMHEYDIDTIDRSREGFDRVSSLIEKGHDPLTISFARYYRLLAKLKPKEAAFHLDRAWQLYKHLRRKCSVWLWTSEWEELAKGFQEEGKRIEIKE